MGSFNAACFVTGQQIKLEDEVMFLMLLQKTGNTFGDYTQLYVTDNWKVVGIPLAATYDDYGWCKSMSADSEEELFATLQTQHLLELVPGSLSEFFMQVREQSTINMTGSSVYKLSYTYVLKEVYDYLSEFGLESVTKKYLATIREYESEFERRDAQRSILEYAVGWTHTFSPIDNDLEALCRLNQFLALCQELYRPVTPMMTSSQVVDYKFYLMAQKKFLEIAENAERKWQNEL